VEDPEDRLRERVDGAAEATAAGPDQPDAPVMPAPPFPTFQSRPALPHQAPQVGFEAGRDSRAR
jgi:hypothetical protein